MQHVQPYRWLLAIAHPVTRADGMGSTPHTFSSWNAGRWSCVHASLPVGILHLSQVVLRPPLSCWPHGTWTVSNTSTHRIPLCWPPGTQTGCLTFTPHLLASWNSGRWSSSRSPCRRAMSHHTTAKLSHDSRNDIANTIRVQRHWWREKGGQSRIVG